MTDVRETCSCGAIYAVNYGKHQGGSYVRHSDIQKDLADWRRDHRHEMREPSEPATEPTSASLEVVK